MEERIRAAKVGDKQDLFVDEQRELDIRLHSVARKIGLGQITIASIYLASWWLLWSYVKPPLSGTIPGTMVVRFLFLLQPILAFIIGPVVFVLLVVLLFDLANRMRQIPVSVAFFLVGVGIAVMAFIVPAFRTHALYFLTGGMVLILMETFWRREFVEGIRLFSVAGVLTTVAFFGFVYFEVLEIFVSH
jgi:hypothetical protein